jgi:hypothetical protein
MFRLILTQWNYFGGRFLFSFHVEETAIRVDTADPDIMASVRRLTDRDISIVASQLGEAWRVLGRQLNFTQETLDAIAESASVLTADTTHKQVRADTRMFSAGETTQTLSWQY